MLILISRLLLFLNFILLCGFDNILLMGELFFGFCGFVAVKRNLYLCFGLFSLLSFSSTILNIFKK